MVYFLAAAAVGLIAARHPNLDEFGPVEETRIVLQVAQVL